MWLALQITLAGIAIIEAIAGFTPPWTGVNTVQAACAVWCAFLFFWTLTQ